jgi:N-acetylneuraminic acid mutarotase
VHWRSIVPPDDSELAQPAVVWTGREVLVWGSVDGSSGFRYEPGRQVFARISAAGAPSARSTPYFAWTGSELIVWGGTGATPGGGSELLDDGARYDPELDQWAPMNPNHGLGALADGVAVWTGTEFIVWGGYSDEFGYAQTGGRYRPDRDQWTPISAVGAPSARRDARAVWTGAEVLVWGGRESIEPGGVQQFTATGGLYDPSTDSWRPTSIDGAPIGASGGNLVWLGQEAFVWPDGARYVPSTDSWLQISDMAAPNLRSDASAVSTGRRVIIYGGRSSTGTQIAVHGDAAIYDPEKDEWSGLPSECSSPRAEHVGVWTDAGAFFWGGFERLGPPGAVPSTGGALLVTPP